MKRIFFAFLFFFTIACSKSTPQAFRVGVDPSFFPLNLKEQSQNVFGFSNDLLLAIAKDQNIDLARVNMSFDNLIEGLQKERYEAILSSLLPNLINNTRYSFSEGYIQLGVVLITRQEAMPPSLETLNGKSVAMGKSADELDLMQTYPNVDFTFYQTYLEALEGVAQGKYAACLIPVLQAHAYVKDLFQNQLMIASDVLTPGALRLITLKDRNHQLINKFNKGLQDIQETGTYTVLLSKWSLYQRKV